jgi:hypothetical protein
VAVVAALALFTLGGCGDDSGADTDVHPDASTGPSADVTDGADHTSGLAVDTAFGSLPVPATGDDAVAALESMPETVGSWSRKPADRGQAVYDHPGGNLGIEAAELADIYARPVTPAEAIRLFSRDFDGGKGRSCSTPPGWCTIGNLEGQPAMAWTHHQSEILVVARWPDAQARDALLDAYRTSAATMAP